MTRKLGVEVLAPQARRALVVRATVMPVQATEGEQAAQARARRALVNRAREERLRLVRPLRLA
jgi:hypothetical protein